MISRSLMSGLKPSSFPKGQLLFLIITNLIPLIGVLFWDWDVFTIIFLFWIENGIIGAFNFFKILSCKGPLTRKIPMSLFFIVHYGFFTSAHGMILLHLFKKGFTGEPWDVWPWALNWIQNIDGQIWLAVIAMIAYWLFDYIQFFLKERKGKDISKQMMEPYSRIIIAHVVLMIGAFIALKFGDGILILLALIVIKTFINYQDLMKKDKINKNVK